MLKLNFSELESGELSLLVAPSHLVQEATLQSAKYFVNRKKNFCVYVTVAKPYKTIFTLLEKKKINTGKVFFIDCATPLTGSAETQAENCVFVQPQSLANLSIALSSAIQTLPPTHPKLLVLDTLSTLMLYNQAPIVAKFMHALAGKLRNWGVRSIIFILEEETDNKIISQLSQFCDNTIRVKG